MRGGRWKRAPVRVSMARATLAAPPSTLECSRATATYSLPAPCWLLTRRVARSTHTIRLPVTCRRAGSAGTQRMALQQAGGRRGHGIPLLPRSLPPLRLPLLQLPSIPAAIRRPSSAALRQRLQALHSTAHSMPRRSPHSTLPPSTAPRCASAGSCPVAALLLHCSCHGIHLGIQGARVAGLLHAQDALDPGHHLV